jgi:Xaa-Pro dipeptidase
MASFTLSEGAGQLLEPLAFSDAEYSARLSKLRNLMRSQGVDYFVSFTPENIYYLTGHDTPGYYFYQACIISLYDPPVNVLRRIESSNTLLKSWSRRVVVYQDTEDPVLATFWYLQQLGLGGRSVGMEADAFFVTPRRYADLSGRLEREGATVVPSQIVEQIRIVKSTEEIRYIREAAAIVSEGMHAAIEASNVGFSEDHIAARTLARLAECGSEYAGLPPFITSGPRSRLCHATWAGRTLRFGDVLAYELPGVRHRYAAALFRCGTVGPAPADAKRLATACIGTLQAVIDFIKPGVTSHEVHATCRRHFEAEGYGHLHGHRTGYSIGINYPPDWGEGHLFSLWDCDERELRAGMVLHLVPGIFLPDRFLINISETVLVTESGCEPLTSFPRELFQVSARKA